MPAFFRTNFGCSWMFCKHGITVNHWRERDLRGPCWCFNNRNIPRLQCCAYRTVPSLDVWVESSCFHCGLTLRLSCYFHPLLLIIKIMCLYVAGTEQAVFTSKKRPLADVQVHPVTSSAHRSLFVPVWRENPRVTPPQDPHSCTCS